MFLNCHDAQLRSLYPDTIEKLPYGVVQLEIQRVQDRGSDRHNTRLPRWVPRLLTMEHKSNHLTTSKMCLVLFNCNQDVFLRRFINLDKTWFHHNKPCSKQQSNKSASLGESARRRRMPRGSVSKQKL